MVKDQTNYEERNLLRERSENLLHLSRLQIVDKTFDLMESETGYF